MSGFWSGWVMFLVVLNLGISLFLFVWGQRVEIPTLEDGTSGHAWAHGVLREGVRRLPTWWVVFSSAMFVGAFGYLLLYPGFGSFTGLLGWSSEEKWERETAANNAKLEPVLQSLLAINLEETGPRDTAAVMGGRLYQDNCAACHGRDGRGRANYPDLTDDDWLWGSGPEAIAETMRVGINTEHPETRFAQMSAFGRDGMLDRDQIRSVSAYVYSLSNPDYSTADNVDLLEDGREVYLMTCAGCHGDDATGMQ